MLYIDACQRTVADRSCIIIQSVTIALSKETKGLYAPFTLITISVLWIFNFLLLRRKRSAEDGDMKTNQRSCAKTHKHSSHGPTESTLQIV